MILTDTSNTPPPPPAAAAAVTDDSTIQRHDVHITSHFFHLRHLFTNFMTYFYAPMLAVVA